MQVYQPFDLCLGVAMTALGLIGTVRDAWRFVRRVFPGGYSDWRSLGASVFFAADGPVHCSRGFDPAHHESHRTAVLLGIALPVMFVVIAASLTAQVLNWRRKKTEQAVSKPSQAAV